MKSKIFQYLTGTFITLTLVFAIGCSKSSDQIQDDELMSSSDAAVMSDEANLGASSAGRGR